MESCYTILDRNREYIAPILYSLYRHQIEKAHSNVDNEVLNIYREMLLDDIFNYSTMKQVDILCNKLELSSSPLKSEYIYEITSYVIDVQIKYNYINKKNKTIKQ